MNIRQDLISKYNKQAPRYTSYPSALYFLEMDDTSRAIDYITKRNTTPRDLSLYIHIPFCASLCWYCGCTKVITRNHGDSRAYLDSLFKEMALVAKHLHPENRVVQIHFGGGTPTFLSPDELRETGNQIRSLFRCADDVAFAVEIDPRRLTRDHVSALAEIGCNRASIGIQDVRKDVQEAINRIQPMSVNEQVVDWLRDFGIRNINVDLIYGLPLQTCRSFESTLEAVRTLDPDRFAIFNYAHVPWMMPSQKLLDRYPMPDAHEKFAMLEMMIDHLTHTGYAYIGMDHFAKERDELAVAQKNGTLQRNFQGYSTRSDCDIYGFGMSSISQIGDAYLQSVKDLDEYYNCISRGKLPYKREYYLSEDDRIRRHTIMSLMCNLEIDFIKIGEKWNIAASDYFADACDALVDLASDGLVVRFENGFRVTPTGRMFLRNIAVSLDAYYSNSDKTGRYSKTV